MDPGTFIEGFRSVLEQAESLTALRSLLFLLGLCGGLVWFRAMPRLALGLITLGACLALSYWLVQIRSPFGLGTDPELTREWAQAGVNAAGARPAGGFVWGTPEESSLIGALAGLGVPIRLVSLLPQVSALLSLAVVVLLPLVLIRNQSTAAFTACLAVAGGLWPGVSHLASFLLRPSRIVVLFLVSAIVFALSRQPGFRRRFNPSRVGVAAILLGVAALRHAKSGDGESEALAPLLLLGATIILASPLRVLLRRASPSAVRARGLEALGIIAVFIGSGLFWFDPATTLTGFLEARRGALALSKPLLWIVQNVPKGDVVLAAPEYSSRIAAVGGRRVLVPPTDAPVGGGPLNQPFRRTRLIKSTLDGRPVKRLAEEFGVTHLFLGPGEPTPPEAETSALSTEPTLRLVLVYQDVEDFRLFRLTKK